MPEHKDALKKAPNSSKDKSSKSKDYLDDGEFGGLPVKPMAITKMGKKGKDASPDVPKGYSQFVGGNPTGPVIKKSGQWAEKVPKPESPKAGKEKLYKSEIQPKKSSLLSSGSKKTESKSGKMKSSNGDLENWTVHESSKKGKEKQVCCSFYNHFTVLFNYTAL